jgi:tRNA threonylcarbamoyladenosine biosynthesis protein TsaE
VRVDLVTDSPAETMNFGENLAADLAPGATVGLIGELGAGKTVLIRGMCRGLGYDGIVNSPTFNLLNIYSGDLEIYHFDWYRLEGLSDLDDLGFEEFVSNERGICLIEWADRISSALPTDVVLLYLDIVSDYKRRIYSPS